MSVANLTKLVHLLGDGLGMDRVLPCGLGGFMPNPVFLTTVLDCIDTLDVDKGERNALLNNIVAYPLSYLNALKVADTPQNSVESFVTLHE